MTRTKAAAKAASSSPNERLRQAALKGLRKRWGPQRVIRLDGIPPAEREAIIALIEAVRAGRATKRRANGKAVTGGLEVPGDGLGGGDRESPAAD